MLHPKKIQSNFFLYFEYLKKFDDHDLNKKFSKIFKKILIVFFSDGAYRETLKNAMARISTTILSLVMNI